MNARTKTFNFPFRGTENHQAYVSINVRKTLDTTLKTPRSHDGHRVMNSSGLRVIRQESMPSAEITSFKPTYQDLAVSSIKVKADYYSQFCYSVVIT